MSDKIKAMVIDEGGFMEAVAQLGGHRVIHLVVDGDTIIDAWFAEIPQPEDASPPLASCPAPGDSLPGGRAAETTIRCTVCRGRGETLWVEQTWNLMDTPETELDECDNCQGCGFELVEVDKVAS